jgi:hypothetical protein
VRVNVAKLDAWIGRDNSQTSILPVGSPEIPSAPLCPQSLLPLGMTRETVVGW